ncbi:MAG: transposase [Gammaproteobacteria bacterium]|nr:transposase [Gammaproteobacteria bacterium]
MVYAYDDAWCESLFATVECALLDRRRFAMVADARGEVFSFIEGFYKRITDKETLGGGRARCARRATQPYTDDTSAYKGGDRPHETVKHLVTEYVRGMAHTNGAESFRAIFKRAHKERFHRLSAKHLQRHVSRFAGRHNIRVLDTIRQMAQWSRRWSVGGSRGGT